MMKRILLALVLCLFASAASAQCNGVFKAGYICGSPSGGVPAQDPLSAFGILTGPSTLNVDHTNGVDQPGCGTVTSGSGACRTIYYAANILQASILPTGTIPVVQSDCNFTETPPQEFIGPSGGNGLLFIFGNPSSPTSCGWTSAGIGASNLASIHVEGFKTINASNGQTWMTATKQAVVVFKNMAFSTATSGTHIQIFDGGTVVFDAGGTYQVGDSGCAPNCMSFHIINNGGTLELSSYTVNVPNVLTFTDWYLGQGSGSNWSSTSLAFSGAGAGAGSTGSPYFIWRNASIRLQGGVLPGNGASSVSEGGCDDNGCIPELVTSFTSLPSSPLVGMMAYIFDGKASNCADTSCTTFGTNVTGGGGALPLLTWWNGTHWTLIGK